MVASPDGHATPTCSAAAPTPASRCCARSRWRRLRRSDPVDQPTLSDRRPTSISLGFMRRFDPGTSTSRWRSARGTCTAGPTARARPGARRASGPGGTSESLSRTPPSTISTSVALAAGRAGCGGELAADRSTARHGWRIRSLSCCGRPRRRRPWSRSSSTPVRLRHALRGRLRVSGAPTGGAGHGRRWTATCATGRRMPRTGGPGSPPRTARVAGLDRLAVDGADRSRLDVCPRRLADPATVLRRDLRRALRAACGSGS